MSIAYRPLPRPTLPPSALRAELDSLSDRAASAVAILVPAVRDELLERELVAHISGSRFVVMGFDDIDAAAVVLVDIRGDAIERMAEVRKMARADAAVVAVVESPADSSAAARAGAFACVDRATIDAQLAGVLAAAFETHLDESDADPSSIVTAAEHNSAIERIGAGLAHELSGPLGIAAMNLDVIRGELARLAREGRSVTNVMSAALHDVESSLEQMNGLLASLGSFVAGASVDLDRIAVSDVVVGVIHRAATPLRGIEVESCIEPLTAVANTPMLEQILLHLTTNAANAARSLPSARIRYHVYKSGDRVVLSVRDNGPGIAAEARARIFEPFYTTRRSQGGRGMGLAICREYARRMGAVLSMWSEPGRGACFRLGLSA